MDILVQKSSQSLYCVGICGVVFCKVTDTVRESAKKYIYQYVKVCEIQNLCEKVVNKLSRFGLTPK
jgi:hypothetical protein